jgi:anti-sigma28 factor (negative regulator of flagellin synthesis)
VVVSQSASKVSDLERAEEAQHAARVDELRAKVESGEYEVDKDRLADRMAEEELARAPK